MKQAETRPSGRTTPKLSSAVAAVLASLATLPAVAETSPYYVGISQAFTRESNVYRLADTQALPGGVKKRGDTIATTTLLGGFDQPWGRQRLYGSAALRASRFASNEHLNNEGYSLNLGMDWSTVERISGNVNVGSQRSLRAFDPNEGSTARNVETVSYASVTGRIGVVTRLTAEATLAWRDVGYSLALYKPAEYSQVGGSVGLRYRLGGATTVGAALRTAQTEFKNNPGDKRRRNDLDLTADWVPNDISSLHARLSFGRTNADLASVADFSGVTGEVRGMWKPTGKLRLNARLLRDTGQESAFINAANTRIASVDYSRISTSLFLGADYAVTSKITLTAGLGYTQRDLNNSLYNLFTGSSSIDGTDNTTTASLGARWQPLRSLQLGCDIGHEQRRTNSNLSLPYGNNTFGCFGQLMLQ